MIMYTLLSIALSHYQFCCLLLKVITLHGGSGESLLPSLALHLRFQAVEGDRKTETEDQLRHLSWGSNPPGHTKRHGGMGFLRQQQAGIRTCRFPCRRCSQIIPSGDTIRTTQTNRSHLIVQPEHQNTDPSRSPKRSPIMTRSRSGTTIKPPERM